MKLLLVPFFAAPSFCPNCCHQTLNLFLIVLFTLKSTLLHQNYIILTEIWPLSRNKDFISAVANLSNRIASLYFKFQLTYNTLLWFFFKPDALLDATLAQELANYDDWLKICHYWLRFKHLLNVMFLSHTRLVIWTNENVVVYRLKCPTKFRYFINNSISLLSRAANCFHLKSQVLKF